MAAVRKEFRLCETLAGILHTVSEGYGMDGCWLPWKFERHVLTGGATPFRITTKEYPSDIKEGVDKVSFEVQYHNDNPNLVKYIRFDELPGREKYIVTQTSMKHIKDGSTCPVWIEIPKGSDRDGIAGAHSLLKAKICCADWKDYLTPSPETELEQAHLTMAQDDVRWLKKQIISQNSNNNRLVSSIAYLRIEVTTLTAQIDKLNIEVAKTDTFKQKIEELKGDIRAESKAKESHVHELEGQLKKVKSEFEKLQTKLKEKTDTITKLRQDLKAKGSVEAESGSDSSTPVPNKRRKIALKTPKNKGQANPAVPNTAPAMHGGFSTIHVVPSSQTLALTPSGTNVTGRTPLPNGPRSQNAQFRPHETSVLDRTRAATMASNHSSDYTPTRAGNTRSDSETSDSSLTPPSGRDSDAFD